MEKTPLLSSRRDKGKLRRFEGVSLLVVSVLSFGFSLWILIGAHFFLGDEGLGIWYSDGEDMVEEDGGEWRWKDVSFKALLAWMVLMS
jgi:hypothetical protein